MSTWRIENVLRNAEYRKRRRAEELKSARFLVDTLDAFPDANHRFNEIRPYRSGHVNNIYDARKFIEEDQINDKQFLSLSSQQQEKSLPQTSGAKVRDIKLKQLTKENMPMSPNSYPRQSLYQEHFNNMNYSRPYICPPPADSSIFATTKPTMNREFRQNKEKDGFQYSIYFDDVNIRKYNGETVDEEAEMYKSIYQDDFATFGSPRPFIYPRPRDSTLFINDKIFDEEGRSGKTRSFVDPKRDLDEFEPKELVARVKSANERNATNRLLNGFERSSIPLAGDNVNQTIGQSVMQADFILSKPLSKPHRVRPPFPPYNPISHTQDLNGKLNLQLPRLNQAMSGTSREVEKQAGINRAMAKMRKFDALSTHIELGRTTPTCLTEYNSCYSYVD